MKSHLARYTGPLAIFLLALMVPLANMPNLNAAAVTPQTLATKINKAGLGCKTIIKKSPMLLKGTKWKCLANGETVSIEVYPLNIWKKVLEYSCIFDLGFIAVTDGKSWIVTPESRSTANKLAKPLGGTVKVFCNKNIINEKKFTPEESTPTPPA